MYALHHLIKEVNLYNSTNKRAAFIKLLERVHDLNGSARIDSNKLSQTLLNQDVEKKIVQLQKELIDEKLSDEFESVLN